MKSHKLKEIVFYYMKITWELAYSYEEEDLLFKEPHFNSQNIKQFIFTTSQDILAKDKKKSLKN